MSHEFDKPSDIKPVDFWMDVARDIVREEDSNLDSSAGTVLSSYSRENALACKLRSSSTAREILGSSTSLLGVASLYFATNNHPRLALLSGSLAALGGAGYLSQYIYQVELMLPKHK